jgi:hypothetical protein
MLRYIVTNDETILQILKNEPLFVPPKTKVHTYDGAEPDDDLIFIHGKIQVKGKIEVPAPAELTVDEYKEQQMGIVEDRVSFVRMMFIPSKPGQSDVYWEKTQEAIDYLSSGSVPDIKQFPFLQIDVDLSGESGESVALSILSRRRQWVAVASKTERIRRTAKYQMIKCTTKNEVDDVVNRTQVELNFIT